MGSVLHPPGQRYPGRLCAICKGAVASIRAQEKMRQQARKKQKQVNEEALKLVAFIMVFTTASNKELALRKCWNCTESAGRSNFDSNISRAYWGWAAYPSMMRNRAGRGFRLSCSADCSLSD